MNREEMLSRLKAGYEPIDVAIEKWQDIVADPRMRRQDFTSCHKEFILDENASNCALCNIYEDDCYECPIVLSGGIECSKGEYYKSCKTENPQLMLDELLRVKCWLDDEACKDREKQGKKVDKPDEPLYHIGQRFIYRGDEYILASTDYKVINMINLKNGNRWSDGCPMVTASKIKGQEMSRFFDEGFVLKED